MIVTHSELRARFAQALSHLYGTEVPAYNTLVDVAEAVNRDYQKAHPDVAERLGSIERVTAERHGAIRVGSPKELSQVARVFGAVGMHPVGFYDLRDAQPNPIPVVSTAFRPTDRDELAKNPFRVFTSMLVPVDRRFFDEVVEERLVTFIGARTLFRAELLHLADSSIEYGGLSPSRADAFIELATASFALSSDPVDRRWYDELEMISSVASDIGGVTSTHINHLTPRVLDIDDLYQRMSGLGITMIDEIQGPPRWDGPDVLLRQTSFRALAEPRNFQEDDGSVSTGHLRVRFGEVEARGIALTVAGREHYDWMVAFADRRQADSGGIRTEVALDVWREHCPASERELLVRDHGYFNFTVAGDPPHGEKPHDLVALVDGGWVTAEPLVYEDFLPRSAAGIFASNLTGEGSVDSSQGAADRDLAWMSDQIGVMVHDPQVIYSREREASFREAIAALGLEVGTISTPWGV